MGQAGTDGFACMLTALGNHFQLPALLQADGHGNCGAQREASIIGIRCYAVGIAHERNRRDQPQPLEGLLSCIATTAVGCLAADTAQNAAALQAIKGSQTM